MKKFLFAICLFIGGWVCIADDYVDDVYYSPINSVTSNKQDAEAELQPTYPSNIKELEFIIIEDSTRNVVSDSTRIG